MIQEKLRKVVRHDAASIAKTFNLSFRLAYTGILPYQQINKIIEQRNPIWWQNYIETYTNIWTIEDKGIVAGYVSFGTNRYDSLPYEGEIYAIYVRPEYQGNGFGKRLLKHALKQMKAKGYEGITGWIIEDNQVGLNLAIGQDGKICGSNYLLHEGARLKKIAICWK